ncbi:MAG TPA: right-handed parallel beta-helix repeat-containing protein, partial [Methylomirabilota bacterium]|nr:right-handed parallel beta-helix repeat-containing protein [Methylomirabilota bacterium]
MSANTTLTGVNAIANPITINTNAFTWSGASDLEFSGPVTLAATPTITVSSTAASIFSGGISGTGFGITKAGAGKLTLNGNNPYNGPTLVSLGTLLVNGSLPNSAPTVASGATLAGNGTLGGVVTVQAGGILAPGASIGTLTLAAEPSLSGNTVMEINRTGLALTSDLLVLTSGTLTYGGQLVVTLLGGSDALAGGNTFTLFSAPGFAGAFAGFTLPTLPIGLAWDTSQLTVNGSISVVCTATPVASAGNDQTNCVGIGVQIGGSPTATGGTAPYTFSWTPATGLSSATVPNPTATPATTTTYTVIATDANGCSSLGASVTLTVDTAAPLITCPTDVTIQCLSAVPAPDFSGGTVSDNTDPSPVVTHVGDVTNGVNPLVITRTYKATDACTNEATFTQTITVQDTIAPVASCKNISVTLVGGNASITPADVNNGSSDNCALNLVSVQPNTFTTANLGPNNVTLTVSDNAEHTNTCVAVVTVNALSTNFYVIEVSDLATGKPEFSPPHGTGTNSFGYDWDSAPPDDTFGAPVGYGDSSFSASVNQAGATEPDRYRTFRIGLRTLFGHNVNVGQVARISYHTKKPAPASEIDWRLTIYTTSQGAGDAGSFYRSRLQATPSNALSLNAPSSQWNTWSTAAGDNEFQFKDNRADFMTENMLWSEIIGGPVTRGASTWNWTAEEVMMVDITLGANSGGGTGLSQIDGVQIELTTGEVADLNLQQNTQLTRYNVQPSDLATGKPQFSPPHGTGTNPFGYDWDSAAPDTAAGAPAGYGCSSYSATVTQAGATEPDRYRTFRIGLRTLFGHNVNVGQVASITYQTKKPTPQTEVDWRLTIYTTPQGAGDAGSFYRSRIQATPSNALGLNAPANQWNTWTTAPAGVNQFQFLEKRPDFMTEDMLWSEITGGPVTRGATTWDWTGEEVMMIDITLGANSGGGDATSQLDAVQIRLSDGSIADINLEALPYTNVYVDDSYTGSPNGTVVTFPNGAGGPSHIIGCDAFATIQGGIDAVASSGTVNVAPGSYLEDVAVNKTVSVLGAGAGQSLVYGPTNGPSATFQVTATGVVIEGFTISRDGNNPTDWNGPLNSAGVAIQGLSANATVRNCWLEGNRTAIDINLSAGNVIANNVLTNNRTGLIFRNDCQNNIVTNNAIVDNWTVGVLWLDTGISGLAQGTVLSRNNISGNWYGQIVDRRVTAGTFDLWNCSGNWLGSSTLTITSANSAEPGYAAQIPVAFGGSAVPPGGAPSLAGPGVANIDYTPWLDVGTDTSVAFGFQGDFSTLHVDDNSPQVGPIGRIQEGVNSVSGSTVLIAAGSYTENIVISSKVTLIGAGSGSGAGDTIITAADTTLPVILIDDAGGSGAGDRLTVKDLRVQGSTAADGIRVRATSAPRAFYRFDNIASVQNPNGAGLQVEGPQNVSDIEVANCILDNNNYGLALSTTIPVFNGLSVTGGEIKDNSTLGLIVNPLGSDATDATTDYSNITVDGTTFANNGNASFAGSGHLVFFRFNGNATIKNVTLSGPTWSPIQFRGEGIDATPGTWQPSGTILLQNVVIGGSGIRPGLYIQDYSAVTGFTFDNVNLGTYLPPDVSGPNGFFAQAMQVRHTGGIKMNLGKLTLPSTVTFSGFLPVSGYYALALTAPGGAQATCDTVILGVTTTQGLEDAVFDADDTALMAALSIPAGAIGDVA